MVRGVNRREKLYVDVIARFTTDGDLVPLKIILPQEAIRDGAHRSEFDIQKVLEVRHAASMKVGGYGLRYKVLIDGKAKHVWQDQDGWYVEHIVNDGICSM